jgi:hypothetical protein
VKGAGGAWAEREAPTAATRGPPCAEVGGDGRRG